MLLFDVLTCSLFQMVWNIVLASWFRRIEPSTKVLPLYIGAAVMIVLQGITGQGFSLLASGLGTGRFGNSNLAFSPAHAGFLAVYVVIALATWVLRLIARFTFKADLDRHFNTVEPLGIQVNGVLLFFFGGIYLQSVMNEINRRRRGYGYGALPPR